MRECATRLRENARQLRENARQLRDRGMRDDARQAGIVEGRGGPSEQPVLTISGSGEGGRKRGGTPEIPTLPRTRKSGIPEGFHREQGDTLSPPR